VVIGECDGMEASRVRAIQAESQVVIDEGDGTDDMEVFRVRATRVASQQVVIGEGDDTDGMEVFRVRATRVASQEVVIGEGDDTDGMEVSTLSETFEKYIQHLQRFILCLLWSQFTCRLPIQTQ
jgi:hypothetical protein